MTMIYPPLSDNITEIGKGYALEVIRQLTGAGFTVAYHHNEITQLGGYAVKGHIRVSPDIMGTVRRPRMQFVAKPATREHFDDFELGKRVDSFRQHVQERFEIEEGIVHWLAEFYGFKSIREERNRRRLLRKFSQQSQETIDPKQRPAGNWTREPKYQALAREAFRATVAATRARQRVDRRLCQLLIHFWDMLPPPTPDVFESPINDIIQSIHTMSKALYFSQSIGFPDILQTALRPSLMKGIEIQKTFTLQIKDQQANKSLASFGQHLQELVDLDEQMVRQLAKLNDLDLGERGRVQLCRRVIQQTQQSIRAYEFPPSWVRDPEYQSLLQKAASVMSAITEAQEQVAAWRLAAMQEVIGDQRAKDLVDQAIEYLGFDPQYPIKLLHRALKYGQTGIQASGAYQELGSRYAGLGDYTKAIEYYTKSMEAWRPNAITLFWRGELYYQRGELEKAQVDFEAALGFSARYERLTSPEREKAEHYLVELRQALEKLAG
jgi:hypothetical protein